MMLTAARSMGVRAVRVAVRKPAAMRTVAGRRVALPKRSSTIVCSWRSGSSGGSSATLSKVAAIKPTDAKNFAMNKGYTLLDIRSTGEHNAGSKRWFVNVPFDGESSFKAAFQKAYPMKSARVIIADAAGSKASDAAAAVAALGYTNVVALEGGIAAYLKVDPLTSKDKVSKGAVPAASSSNGSSAASESRFSFTSKAAAPAASSSSFKSSSASKLQALKPHDAKNYAMNKGFTLLDIRSAQEHNAASKRWFVNLPFDSESSFKAAFQKQFPMKSARIILACDDGSDRTSGAAGALSSLGYTNVVTLEGGVNAYLRVDPLTSKDRSSGAAPARASAPAAASSGSSDRFSFSSKAAAPADRASSSFAWEKSAAPAGKYGTIKPAEAKSLALNKGFAFVDVRSAADHARGAKPWMMNMPVDSANFKADFQYRFFNKLARVIIACEDGSSKSTQAANIVTGLGYTNIKVLEGGMSAYLKFDPITGKAAKPSFGSARPASAPAAAPAPAAPAASDRFSFASKASSAPAKSAGSSSASSGRVQTVKPAEAKKLALDKGYVLVDTRSASEHARGAKKWFVNIPAESEARFKDAVKKQYPFTSARLIVGDASAANALYSAGYTNIVTVEGGVAGYLKYDPLTTKDQKPVARR